MWLDGLILAAGIALLVGGGEAMVRGAAALARQLGVSPLVIGLTVVAFGTSAPELAVNLTAALQGTGAMAFGNLVGSNLANIGLILAGTAILRRLSIEGSVITREIPMMLLASVAALVMGVDALRGEPESMVDRSEGLLLLLFFGIFLYYTIAETLRKRGSDPFVEQASEQHAGERLQSMSGSTVLVVAGLVGLTLGGRFTVEGAVDLATALGAPKALVGLTVVAVGTSLPELSASLIAARRGESDLAVGNVVGSNIFNLLFVLGVTACVRPVPVPADGRADLIAMSGFAVALFVICMVRRGIGRIEGLALLAAYVGYVSWRLL